MKLTLTRMLLVPVAAAALLIAAPSAEAGNKHHHHHSPFVKVKFTAPSFGFGFNHCAPVYAPVYAPRPVVHVHSHHIVYDKVWCAPVYDTVVVGYNWFGRPITRRVVVTQGYWKTAKYSTCGCGDKSFLGYC